MTDEEIQKWHDSMPANICAWGSFALRLMDEVATLRTENKSYQRTIVALTSGWQSVADGAKPDVACWYVAKIQTQPASLSSGMTASVTYYTVHASGSEQPSAVNCFLVIPPPPIKRES